MGFISLQALCSKAECTFKAEERWLSSTHQIAHNDLRASLHCQVQRGQFGGILDPRVDIGLHTDQEQHALDVRVLNSHMEEIPTFIINLWQKGHMKLIH